MSMCGVRVCLWGDWGGGASKPLMVTILGQPYHVDTADSSTFANREAAWTKTTDVVNSIRHRHQYKEQFIQQHQGGFQGSPAVARVPKFAVHVHGTKNCTCLFG